MNLAKVLIGFWVMIAAMAAVTGLAGREPLDLSLEVAALIASALTFALILIFLLLCWAVERANRL